MKLDFSQLSQPAKAPMAVAVEAITRAIKLLDAAGCKYAIVTAEGAKHGELSIAEPARKPKRAGPRHERGTLKAYYEPLVKTIEAGSCAVIPYGPFAASEDDKKSLRSAVCSHCSAVWGNGSYISHMNEAGIELLRIE